MRLSDNDYSNYTDEELVAALQGKKLCLGDGAADDAVAGDVAGDLTDAAADVSTVDDRIPLSEADLDAIEEYLMKKYRGLIKNKALTMFLIGAETDDLIQEGMLGLMRAIRHYDPARDASFHTFAKLCITRKMYTAVEASGRKKNMPLNSYVSFSQIIEGESLDLEEILIDGATESPEEIMLLKEQNERMERLIETELSPLEGEAFRLSLTGLKAAEIARVLGKEAKATENALGRAKTKLKKLIASMDA